MACLGLPKALVSVSPDSARRWDQESLKVTENRDEHENTLELCSPMPGGGGDHKRFEKS